MKLTTTLCVSIVLAAISPALLAQPRQGPPPVTSPEIQTTTKVTFQIRAPEAKAVRLNAPGDIPDVPRQGGVEMTKNAEGVWQYAIDNLASGAYRYSFNVDGVATLDPVNPNVSQSNENPWSWIYIPGSGFMDEQAVPTAGTRRVATGFPVE